MTQTKNKNIDKEDEAFRTILRGIETRMSENILSTMYGEIRTDDESADGHYVLQWTSELHTLQEEKDIQGYSPITTACM